MIILSGANQSEMESIHDGSFPLPILSSCISGKTIIDNGELVSIGLLKITTEAILISNKKTPKITRARALRALMNELDRELKYRNLPDCHIFAKDPKVVNILRHLGFIPCDAGEAMVVQIGTQRR